MNKTFIRCLSVMIVSMMLFTGCAVNQGGSPVIEENVTVLNTVRDDIYKEKVIKVNVDKPNLYGDTIQISSSFAQFTASTASLLRDSRTIKINERSTQLISLFTEDGKSALGFSIIPNPNKALTVTINPQTTAETLVFMNPALATAENKLAEKIMGMIKVIPETKSLARVIEKKVQQDPNYLDKPDVEIERYLKSAVNKVVDKLAQQYSEAKKDERNRVSGVEINVTKQNDITADLNIKNYKKRSSDLYFLNSDNSPLYKESLSSAGNFIDLNNLRLGRNPFIKNVGFDIQRKMSKVEVIGMGLKDIKQFKNEWKDLSLQQKMKFGIPVVKSLMNDFVNPIISIISGFNVNKVWATGWTRVLKNLPIIEIVNHFRNKDYGKAFKAVLSGTIKALVERNGALLKELLKAAGLNLTGAILKKINAIAGVFYLIRHGIEVVRALYAYATTSIVSFFNVENNSGKLEFVRSTKSYSFKDSKALK